jgi:hypothetical protein
LSKKISKNKKPEENSLAAAAADKKKIKCDKISKKDIPKYTLNKDFSIE